MRWPGSSSTKPSSERLLDAELLAALRGLSLPERRVRGAMAGAHPGSQPGRGEDFFQHRAYVRGEDVRAVDWRASARTGHLLVKERHRPLRQPLALFVDRSASMDFPLAGPAKALRALQVAAGIALLALRRGDPVTAFALAPAGFRAAGRALPSGSALAAETVAASVPACGEAHVLRALAQVRSSGLAGAHAVVLSDLYGDEALFGPAVAALVRGGVAVTVFHVLSPAERAVRAGAVRDLESGSVRAVDAAGAAELTGRVEAWSGRLAAAARQAGAEWVGVDAGVHPAATLRAWLRA